MTKHNFKIGDKVKLIGSFCGISGDDVGKVVSVSDYIEVSWGGCLGKSLGGTYPHKISEIEHVIEVGRQLMFSFMGG